MGMVNQVELNGKCTLQINTMRSRTKIEIPKLNREGINNADNLIDTVLHFAIMRHGTDKVIEILNEKIKDYPDYKEKGLSYED